MKTENKKSRLGKWKYKFDKISSNNAKDWQLALFWIVSFELFAAYFEYYFVEKSHAYIHYTPNAVFTQFEIALFVVPFVWLLIYNLINMNKSNLLYLGLYGMVGLYLYLTHDVTFNLLLHNLNPFELNLGGSLYFVIQLILKVIITYLIYKLVIAYRRKNL